MKREEDSEEEDEKTGGGEGDHGKQDSGSFGFFFCSTGWKSLKSSQKVFLFLFLKARVR